MAAEASHPTAASYSDGATRGDGSPSTPKKLHGRAFYESIGSPKFVVAPMVDQSEFAWRMLSRSFLPQSERRNILAYTPMFHARLFVESSKYRESHFQPTREPWGGVTETNSSSSASPSPSLSSTSPVSASHAPTPTPWLDGNPAFDRPLFVQFCANDPDTLLAAARMVAPYCDAVDLNLGCPQGIARKGRYGAFLQEDPDLIYRLVNTLHRHLPVPVTAKIRILDTPEATLRYARTVLDAGASILAVHGRRREQKGHLTGLADWSVIRYLRDNLPPDTVLFANGNVLRREDLARCLEATGADAVLTAEAHLSDPALFAAPPTLLPLGVENREYWWAAGAAEGNEERGGRRRRRRGGWRVDAIMRRYLDILHRYALDEEPPARRPLFVPGDDTAWLKDNDDPANNNNSSSSSSNNNAEDQPQRESTARQPPKKKQKKSEDEKSGSKASSSSKKTDSPNLTAAQAHLFHLLRHLVTRHTDVRDALARARSGDVALLERILDAVERKVAAGLLEEAASTTGQQTAGKQRGEEEKEEEEEEDDDYGAEIDPESSDRAVRACRRPWWVAQPIVRPLPKEAIAKGAVTLKKKDKKEGDVADTGASSPAPVAPGANGANGANGTNGTNGLEAALEKKTSFPQSELVSG